MILAPAVPPRHAGPDPFSFRPPVDTLHPRRLSPLPAARPTPAARRRHPGLAAGRLAGTEHMRRMRLIALLFVPLALTMAPLPVAAGTAPGAASVRAARRAALD